MLVLTRHVHQSIVIGHDVVVTVLEVRGDQVRLGITAPKDIQVHREEVFAALTAANRQAATSVAELEVLRQLADGHRGSPTGSSPTGEPRPGATRAAAVERSSDETPPSPGPSPSPGPPAPSAQTGYGAAGARRSSAPPPPRRAAEPDPLP